MELVQFSLTGWTGDNAGGIVGRTFSTLLIGFSAGEGGDDARKYFYEDQFDVGGMKVYPWLMVSCLTPGARPAVVTDVQVPGHRTFALRVTELNGLEGEPWEPGVHLYSLTLYHPRATGWSRALATALATAIIPETKGEVIDLTHQDVASAWIKGMDRVHRNAWGREGSPWVGIPTTDGGQRHDRFAVHRRA